MSNYWVDANILLRFITNDPLNLAERSARFLQKAEQGEITLKVSSIVVAEVVWVLISFYGYSRQQVADVLIGLLTSEGIILESSEQVIAALDSMATANVDFVDAYLAEVARKENESVASFDRDFKRLDIRYIEPD
ncbi:MULTISPECIES: PIN domain-containing protein [Planktothrix]|jgi:predicted nucleic acid-binding protein|uniref:Ribonuclease VapC n=3 Tax=Planktothrix TaxID=54304 RepID=A0A1J1J9N2_PLAAG|nr:MULTISPECIES: PIN domain-containing protein [Planktothrix]CAD5970828.1 Ribonuclease VapC [Planktothrix rubescens]MBG0749002.1 PIN domain-containing protein [Planktothrix agardhii KL2]MCF3575943.1 PIN domain-containing protein [Planktothrix agardhii 1812]MCF3580255.1 PIN domain-containing protein [Planktothrix agardhii 1811]MCF3624823.1 PIN domain-containing protein [Planktothrix agardhii 1801]